MQELIALKAMLSKDLYVKYSPIMFKIDNMQKEHKSVLNSVKQYYTKYRDKEEIDVGELQAFWEYQNPAPKDPKAYEMLFTGLKSTKVENPDLMVDILNRVAERHLMAEIGQVATEVVQDSRPTGMDDIEELTQRFRDLQGNIQDADLDVCDESLTELLALDTTDGLRWRLGCLNRLFGPIKVSTLGHIFARPDAGKTSLALGEVTFFAGQFPAEGSPILYLNNEEDIRRIKLRSYCAMMGVSTKWLLEYPIHAEELWEKGGGKQIKFIGGVNHIAQVETYIKAFEPRLVIIDQGPKVDVNVRKSASDPTRIQILYKNYRDFASEYECSVITLGQADREAENRKYLSLNNIDGAKTGMPGELDWAMGVGRVHETGFEYVRFLNVCKNKLTGLYGHADVQFNPLKCRYSDSQEGE